MLKYILVSNFIVCVGIFGFFFLRKHIILILICIELIFLAININFIVGSVYLDDIIGQVYSLSVLTVAAAEAAIGLALVVIYYKLNGSIAVDAISKINNKNIKK